MASESIAMVLPRSSADTWYTYIRLMNFGISSHRQTLNRAETLSLLHRALPCSPLDHQSWATVPWGQLPPGGKPEVVEGWCLPQEAAGIQGPTSVRLGAKEGRSPLTPKVLRFQAKSQEGS